MVRDFRYPLKQQKQSAAYSLWYHVLYHVVDCMICCVELSIYLLLHILEGTGTDDGETDEEDVRLRIGERTQPIIVLLTGCIEKAECVRLAANHNRYCVIIEDGRHVFRWELVGGVGDKQAGLTHSSITHHNAFNRLHSFTGETLDLLTANSYTLQIDGREYI